MVVLPWLSVVCESSFQNYRDSLPAPQNEETEVRAVTLHWQLLRDLYNGWQYNR